MRDGHNGYGPSAGIAPAREAVAAELHGRRLAGFARPRVHHRRHVGRDRTGAERAGRPGDDVLVPMPTYPLYTAVLAKLGARAVYYRTDPLARVDAGPRSPRTASSHRRRERSSSSIRTIRPARSIPHRCGARCIELRGATWVSRSSPTRCTAISATTARSRRSAVSIPTRHHLVLESVEGVSLRPAGARVGWRSAASPRLDDVVDGDQKLADGRLCSTVPMQYAVAAALTGDRSHQVSFRAALKERASLTGESLRAMPGVTCMTPAAGFYAMPQGHAAARPDRRGLRARAAARDGRAVRLRIRLRPPTGRWVPSHRVPGVTCRARRGLRLMAEFTADYLRH